MEKKKKSKIQKWDEIGGVVETEVEESISDSSETAGTVIALDKNPLRAVEDSIEQNDNSFDGIINNMPDDKPAAQVTREDVIEAEQKRKSILEKLKIDPSDEERRRSIPRGCALTEREIK